MYTKRSLFTIFCQFILVSIFVLSSSSCANISRLQQPSINAAVNIQPKDPNLKQLMALVSQVRVEASGEFQAGAYTISGKKIEIRPGTKFKFSLTLPIDDPQTISTEKAYSQLWTSLPIEVCGIPVPSTLTLDKGKVTGELDFARIFTVLLVNILEDQVPTHAQAKNLRAMISSLNIKKTELEFRPDSILGKEGKTIHIGSPSKMVLTDLIVDADSNFVGNCRLNINFMPGCKWLGKTLECEFNGGNAQLNLSATRNNHILNFALSNPKDQLVNLHDCTFIFGKDKLSLAYSKNAMIYLQGFNWKKEESNQHADYDISAAMDLFRPEVKIKTVAQETKAKFADIVKAEIQINKNQTEQATKFQTTRAALAESTTIKIHRPTSALELYLNKSTIGPISLNKAGELNLSLAKGTAKLKRLRWSNGKKYFELATAGSSDLGIPEGMSLSVDKDSKFSMKLPLTITLGSAQLCSSSGLFNLESLNGKMLINIDPEVALNGDADFCLKNSTFLGSQKIAMKVRGFNLVANKNKTLVKLAKCSVTVPNVDLQKTIQAQISPDRTLSLDKTIFTKQHWRYKNAEIKTVTLHKLILNKLSVNDTNSAKFSVNGNAIVDGTIDKSSLISVIKKSDNYQCKPWEIKTKCLGDGTLKFSFIPGTNLSSSKFVYDVEANLPIPKDVDLDWSKVTAGICGSMEHGVILSVIKSMKPIPIKYHGDRKLFADDNRFKTINVSNLVTKQVSSGVELSFAGNATF